MRILLAAVKLQCAAALLIGCSPTLDFDGTTKGGGDGVDLPDAGGAENFSCDAIGDSATFCDDFEGPVLGALWSVLQAPAVEGVKVDQTSAAPLAGDRAMVATVPGDLPDDTEYVSSGVERAFPEFENMSFSCVIEFAMAVDKLDPGKESPYISAFQFLMGKTTGTDLNQLVLRVIAHESSFAVMFAENDIPEGDGIAGSPFAGAPLGEWAQVHFELDVDDPLGEGNHVRMSIDGASIADFDLRFPLRGLTPRMQLGIVYQNPVGDDGAWTIRYDNVLAVCD